MAYGIQNGMEVGVQSAGLTAEQKAVLLIGKEGGVEARTCVYFGTH